MVYRLIIILCIFTSALSSDPIQALEKENPAAISPGSRVRIFKRYDPQAIIGTIVTVNPDTLVLNIEKGQNLKVPIPSIAQLDKSMGVDNKAEKGFLYGLGVGFLIGTTFSFSSCGAPSDGDFVSAPDCFAPNPGKVILPTLGCAVIGTAIGSLFAKEIWENVSVETIKLGLVPQQRGGVHLVATINF